MNGNIVRLLPIALAGLLAVAPAASLLGATAVLTIATMPPAALVCDTTPEQLRSIEHRARKAIASTIPTVVAIGDQGHGSGVIVTPQGLILSQAHVSHSRSAEPFDSRQPVKPGTKIKVVLHDGTPSEAELLGFDAQYDLSLLQLTKPGPYPFAPLADQSVVGLGDWVIKIGHPGAYQADRGPVARLGRVLCTGADSFVADCLVQGGDSGGPYFDLDGRLVGIIRGRELPKPVTESAGGFRERGGDMCLSVTPTPFIQTRLESMKKGEIRYPKEGNSHRAWIDFAGPVLPASEWTNGVTTLSAYRAIIAEAGNSVVKILDGDRSVAFGTVVDSSGSVLTIASQLPKNPSCQLADGRRVNAERVGVVPAFDLALLKLPTGNLRPIAWTEIVAAPPGSILCAPGHDSIALAAGIVSVKRRERPGPAAKEVRPFRPLPRCKAAVLPIIGSAVPERGYWVEFAVGEAADSGIRSGDLLLSVAGKAVRSHEDLASSIQGLFGGDRIKVELLRGQTQVRLSVTLRSEGFPTGIMGATRSDYPTFLEHDLPLREDECGGPVIGLDGWAYGITIARSHPEGCIAIPADVILKLLKEFQAGKHSISGTSAQAPPSQKESFVSAGHTIAELTANLRERSARFKSLLVEYEVTTEPRMDAKRLMSWNLLLTRSEKETHTIAFAGHRRFAEALRSGIAPFAAPPDSVDPDPLAPTDIAAIVKRRKVDALARRWSGDFSYLFVRQGRRELTRYAYDGQRCSVWNDAEGSWSMSLPSLFESPSIYLAGLGLRPLDPAASEEAQRIQSYDWFPDNVASYRRCTIRPNKGTMEGNPCVVLEGERAAEGEGQGKGTVDIIWFGPEIGYAPRRREQRVNDLLTVSWSHSSFKDFGGGCWLPQQSVKTVYAPYWVAVPYRGQAVYEHRMFVKSVVVSNVPDGVFHAE